MLQISPAAGLEAAAKELARMGLIFPEHSSDDLALVSLPLTLRHDWRGKPLSQSIDCGIDASGYREVMLPLAEEPVNGFGKLTLTVHLAASDTLLDLQDEVVLYPPWYEQGDRPRRTCHVAVPLGAEIATAIRAALIPAAH